MTTDTGAKGKGFWRRRRRKTDPEPTPAAEPKSASESTPADADATAPTADAESTAKSSEPATADAKPASESTPADAEATAAPAADAKSAAESSDPATADAKRAPESASADAEATAPAADVKPASESTPADAEASTPADAKHAAEPTPADADPKQESASESTPDAAEAKPAADGSTDASTESSPEAAAASSNKSAEGDEAKPTDAVEPDKSEPVDESKDKPADENKSEPSENEGSGDDRPAVGVTYAPEESPDGFPLEFGEIIIGLPKGEVPESERMVDPLTVAADVPDDKPKKSSKKTAAKKPPVVAETPEEPAAEDAPTDEKVKDGTPAADVPDEPATAETTPDTEEPTDEAEAKDEPAADVEEAATPAATEAEEATEAKAEAKDEPEATEAKDEPEAAEVEEEPAVVEAKDEPEVAEAKDEPEAAEDEPAAVEAVEEPVVAEESAKADEPADETPTEDSAADEPASEDVADDKAESVASAADESAEEPTSEDAEASDTDEASDEADSDSEAAEGASAAEGVSADEAADSAEADSDSAEADSDSAEADADDAGSDSAEAEEADDAEPEVVLSAEELAAKAAEQQAAMALITALMKLRGALADSKLPLDVVGADEARQQRKAMLDQLDDYVLPRLVQLEAPVLAVVGGSTGAGKSTLVNSLIGQVVSEPGVLRPTTRSPVLIHHPADAEWFAGDRVLPGMARSSGDSPGGMEDPGQIRLVAADTIPRGLAVLDAPDIDSVVEANRDLATQLLAAADLWLFVTTAARYADAVPWEFLQSASDRSTAVAVVLDRAPADTIDDITGHLAQMLLERGLGDSPLFSIKETVVDDRGMLPNETVASIKDWLIDLAADAEARSAVVRRTLQGAVTAMTKKTPAFSKAVRDQADTFVELRANAETAYERAVKDIAKATQDGTMLRGEVLARWQEFVGTGELLKGLQTNVGRMRDKVRASIVGKPPPTRDLNDAVESGLESLLREHAEAAAERAEESWQSTAAGRQLLAAGERDLGRMSKDFPAAAGRAVREWQGYVLDLVRKEGADKRSTARILAYGVNGLGLSLMVVIFASTAGITGAEVGVGAGTAVVGQKLLEAVFGDQAVRSLAAKARQDLDDRVHALMDAEFARYLAVLDQHPVDPEAPRQLTEAARAVEDCT
ncbi:GTPase domain-containing protein [Kribbella endophytica]